MLFYFYWRHISSYLQRYIPLINLPGSVEIDECHLSGRRKGDHRRLPAPVNMIFGIICRTSKITLLFPVKDKGKNTLFSIIQ